MAQLKNKIVFSAMVVVIAGLAACGKPAERNKIVPETAKPTVASPLADPAKAAEANKKADDVAIADEAAKTAALEMAKKNGAPEDEIKKLEAQLEAAQAARAANQKDAKQSAADACGLFATCSGTPAAPPAAQASDVKDEAKTDADPLAAASGASAPAASASGATASGQQVFQLDPVTVTGVSDATKLKFIMAAIEPLMVSDAAVFRARSKIEAMVAKSATAKNSLDESEVKQLGDLKAEYKVSGGESYASLLARVDGVNLPYVIAPIAIAANWNLLKVDLKAEIANRILQLNTSNDDEAVRFRSARIGLRGVNNLAQNVAMMKAVQEGSPQLPALLDVVEDVVRVQVSNAAFSTEVLRVRDLIASPAP